MSAFEWLLVALGIGALFLAGWAFARSVLEEFPNCRCDDWELRDYTRWLAKREAAQTKEGKL